MPKRKWTDTNSSSPNTSLPPDTPILAVSPSHARSRTLDSPQKPPYRQNTSFHGQEQGPPLKRKSATTKNGLGGTIGGSKPLCISRKVKACAACRKQKIKCLMGPGDAPPCERCKERGLTCQLNKSLQTLMTEDSRWKAFVTNDISNLHSSLQTILQSLSLPGLPSPQVLTEAPAVQIEFDQDNDHDDGDEEENPSEDDDPRLSPTVDQVTYTQDPIQSLYQITGLKSLRYSDTVTDEQKRLCKQLRDTDFIARGLVSLPDAEILANYYLTRLDPYLFNMNAQYETLDDLRRRSPTLTAAILTVAALHDVSAKSELYNICNREFRRLVANAMFERRIDMEYLRALVVGSYWLSDIGWTLSGFAIRRASEFHLKTCYYQIADSLKSPNKYTIGQLNEARDGLRLLYLLYICDHHLSILYGRVPIMRDNEQYITGYETYLASVVATDKDKRVGAQISLLLLFSRIRESLGREEDTRTVLPEYLLPKIKKFEGELENWTSRWANVHNPNKQIGTFPKKGTYVHHYFIKLYLDAHVFRGLSSASSSNTSDIPHVFVETASSAVEAATSLITIILEDTELQIGLAGVPHYFFGMIAFACVFLVKAATKHGIQLQIDPREIRTLIERLSDQLSATSVGRGHLIHRMAGGLRKMVASLSQPKNQSAKPVAGFPYPNTQTVGYSPTGSAPTIDTNGVTSDQFTRMDGTELGLGNTNTGFGMPFFDFEGMNFDLTTPMYSFPDVGMAEELLH